MVRKFNPVRVQNPQKEDGHIVRLGPLQEFQIELEKPEDVFGKEMEGAEWKVSSASKFFRLKEKKLKAPYKNTGKTIYIFEQNYDLSEWSNISSVYLGKVDVYVEKKVGFSVTRYARTQSKICAFLACSNKRKDYVITAIAPPKRDTIKVEPDQILEFVVFEDMSDPELEWRAYVMPFKIKSPSFELNLLHESKIIGDFSPIKKEHSYQLTRRAIDFNNVESLELPFIKKSEHHFWFSFREEDIEKIFSNNLSNQCYEAVNLYVVGKDSKGITHKTYNNIIGFNVNSRARKRLQGKTYLLRRNAKNEIETNPFDYLDKVTINGTWSGAYFENKKKSQIANPKSVITFDIPSPDSVLKVAIARPNFYYKDFSVEDKWTVTVEIPESEESGRCEIRERDEIVVANHHIQLFEIAPLEEVKNIIKKNPDRSQIFLGIVKFCCQPSNKAENGYEKEINLFVEPNAENKKTPIYKTPSNPYMGVRPTYKNNNGSSYRTYYSNKSYKSKKRHCDDDYSEVVLDSVYIGEEVHTNETFVLSGSGTLSSSNYSANTHEWSEDGDWYDIPFQPAATPSPLGSEVRELIKRKNKEDNEKLKDIAPSDTMGNVDIIDLANRIKIPPFYNPSHSTNFTIKHNEVLCIRMVNPEVILGESHQDHLWTMNYISNPYSKCRLWVHENSCQREDDVVFQEFKITVVVPENLQLEESIKRIGLIQFGCGFNRRIIYVNLETGESHSSNHEYFSCLNAVNPIGEHIGDPATLKYVEEEGVVKIHDVSSDNFVNIDPSKEKLEIIIKEPFKTKWDFVLNGEASKRNITPLEIYTWTNWDGEKCKKALFDISNAPANFLGQIIVLKNKIKISSIYVWKMSKANEAKYEKPLVRVKSQLSVGKDACIKNWKNGEDFFVHPQDRFHIDLPKPSKIISHIDKETNPRWEIQIEQTPLPDEVWKVIDKVGINKRQPWFSNGKGVIDPSFPPSEGVRYTFQAIQDYQTKVYDIIDSYREMFSNQNAIHIAKVIFTCHFCDDFSLQKYLNIHLIEYYPCKDNKSKEMLVTDPQDHQSIRINTGKTLVVSVRKKICTTKSTRTTHCWKIEEFPPFATLLIDKSSSTNNVQQFKFSLTNSKSHKTGRIVLKNGDLRKRINLEVVPQDE